jgi:hypothetical protein
MRKPKLNMPPRTEGQLDLSNLYVRWISGQLLPDDAWLVLQHSEELEAMRQRSIEFYFMRGAGETDWFEPK